MRREEILAFYRNAVCFELTEEMLPENCDLVVGNIDLPVTTRCTMKCKHCSSMIPMYNTPEDFSLDEILSGLQRFLECIDLVVRVNVLGGEPMLYPHLDKVIEALNNSDKVYHVVLTTNGTVTPKTESLYQALCNPKNEVRISNYAQYERYSEKLVEKLEEYGVYYTLKKFGKNDFLWFDFGDFRKRDRIADYLREQYRRCDVEWYSLLHGKLFPCPRAAHATDLGIIEKTKDNYIDFLDTSKSIKELKGELENFVFQKDFYEACRYCDRGTEFCQEVIVAEQMD